MKKLLLTLTILSFSLSWAYGQYTRYVDEVFSQVTVHVGDPNVGSARSKGIAYGWPVRKFGGVSSPADSVRCYIYEPTGDTVSKRPVLLLGANTAFLGSGFVDGSFPVPSGTVDDIWLQKAASSLAKRGYVVVAYTYRLGWNPLDNNPTKSIIEAVLRGVQDLKALVRYVKYTAKAKGNPYKIDTNKIAAGGSVAAGYLGLNAIALDTPNEFKYPTLIDPGTGQSLLGAEVLSPTATSPFDTLAGIEGFTALPEAVAAGTSSKFQLVLNFGGSVPDTNFFTSGAQAPVLCAHGVLDANTPYTYGTVYANTGGSTPTAIIDVYGSYNIMKKVNNLGLNSAITSTYPGGTTLEPFSGLRPFYTSAARAYQPWAARPVGQSGWTQGRADTNNLVLDTLLKFLSPRIKLIFGLPTVNFTTAVDPAKNAENLLQVYPVPATDKMTLSMTEGKPYYAILTDVNGRLVRRFDGLTSGDNTLDVFTVNPGIYFLQVTTSYGPAVRRVVIE
jgi:hypothetical protein